LTGVTKKDTTKYKPKVKPNMFHVFWAFAARGYFAMCARWRFYWLARLLIISLTLNLIQSLFEAKPMCQ